MLSRTFLSLFLLLASSLASFATWTPGGGWHTTAWDASRLTPPEQATLWVTEQSITITNAVSCTDTGGIAYVENTIEFWSDISISNQGDTVNTWSFRIRSFDTNCVASYSTLFVTTTNSQTEESLYLNAEDIRNIDTYFAIRERLDMLGLWGSGATFDADSSIHPGLEAPIFYRDNRTALSHYKEQLLLIEQQFVSPGAEPQDFSMWRFYVPGTNVGAARWHYTNAYDGLSYPPKRFSENFIEWTFTSMNNPTSPGARSFYVPDREPEIPPYERPNQFLDFLSTLDWNKGESLMIAGAAVASASEVFYLTSNVPGETFGPMNHILGHEVGESLQKYAWDVSLSSTETVYSSSYFDITPPRSWFGATGAGSTVDHVFMFDTNTARTNAITNVLITALNYYADVSETGNYFYVWSGVDGTNSLEVLFNNTATVYSVTASGNIGYTQTVETGLASGYYEGDYDWLEIRGLFSNLTSIAAPVEISDHLQYEWDNYPDGNAASYSPLCGYTNYDDRNGWSELNFDFSVTNQSFSTTGSVSQTALSELSYIIESSFNVDATATYLQQVTSNACDPNFTETRYYMDGGNDFYDGGSPVFVWEYEEASGSVDHLSTNLAATVKVFWWKQCIIQQASTYTNTYVMEVGGVTATVFVVDQADSGCDFPDYVVRDNIEITKAAADNAASVSISMLDAVSGYGEVGFDQDSASDSDTDIACAHYYARSRKDRLYIFPYAVVTYQNPVYE